MLHRKFISYSARALSVLAVIGLVQGVTGCKPSKNSAEMTLEVRFGVDLSVISAPVWIAEGQDYFKQEGINVNIIDYPSGKTALGEMIEKRNLDIVTVAQTPVMYNSFVNDNYAIITGMADSWEDVLALARRDANISTIADLKGKKVGTPVGSSGHFFLNLLLFYNGLNITDVTVVDVDAPNLPAALQEGAVDAIAIWQPHIYNAMALLGETANLLPSKNIYREDFYIVARKDFIKDNPEVLKRFLKGLTRAEEFVQQRPQDSIKIVAKRLKLDETAVASFWDSYEFQLFLDQTILIDLEAEARWAISNRYTTAANIPDYNNFIYHDILEDLKPEAVNIIR